MMATWSYCNTPSSNSLAMQGNHVPRKGIWGQSGSGFRGPLAICLCATSCMSVMRVSKFVSSFQKPLSQCLSPPKGKFRAHRNSELLPQPWLPSDCLEELTGLDVVCLCEVRNWDKEIVSIAW